MMIILYIRNALDVFDELPLHQFGGEETRDFYRVVSAACYVGVHHVFYPFPVHVGPDQRTRIQEHILDERRQLIPIPVSKVVIFMSSEKEPFYVKRAQDP